MVIAHVDFNLKPTGYREAVVTYFDQLVKRNLPVLFEYGVPNLEDLPMLHAYRRLRMIDDYRLAAKAPVPVVTDTGFTLKLSQFGCKGTLVDESYEYAVSTRMILTIDPDEPLTKCVKEILGFDLILASNHTDTIGIV